LIRSHQSTLALALAGAIYAVAAILPLGQLAAMLGAEGLQGLALLGTARPWQLLGRSVAIAAATTTFCLALGIPLGLVLAHPGVPGRRVLLAVHTFVFFLPPFLPALGWFHLFGATGYLGSAASSSILFSAPGVVLVLGLALTPVVTSLLALAVGNLDPSLQEAALLVARPGRVLVRIALPLVVPALVLAAIIVFTLALSELGVPMFLRVDVFPAAVFARLGGVDFAPGEAVALCLPLLPVLAGLLSVERHFAARRAFAVLGPRSLQRHSLTLRFGGSRLPPVIAVWALALLPAAPLAALAGRALAGSGSGVSTVLRWAGPAPLNSVAAAAAAATLALGIAMVVGHGAARGRTTALGLDAAALLGFILPAAILGIGLQTTWNRDATQAIYGSLAIVVLAFLARYAVVAVRVAATTFGQIPVELEQAAAVAGASFARRLSRILTPLNRPGLAAAWLATFVFCLRDLETAVLLYPPGGETLTVRIFTLEANGPPAVVAGLALIQVGLTATALGAAAVLLTRWGRP
jgi:iron(III) transport system permease protein